MVMLRQSSQVLLSELHTHIGLQGLQKNSSRWYPGGHFVQTDRL
jgi:hypothetical protein